VSKPDYQKSTGGAFAWRLALLYSALCAALGVQMPFLPVWFAAKGLDAAAVGVALAIPLAVRLLAIPFASRIADQFDAVRAVIVSCAAASLLGYSVIGLMQAPAAIMAAVALASMFYTPLMSLADAYALRGLALRGRSYGPVRLWGSAAFIAGTLGGGILLDIVDARALIWVVVALMGVNAAAACALAPLGEKALQPQSISVNVLLRDRRFVGAALAAGFIQASHAVYYGFSALQWRSAGYDGVIIATLWTVGVIAEIVLFAASARIALNPALLLFAGSVGAVVRWAGMAFDPAGGLLVALQCLHAFSFGATHLGALAFVARAAPAGLGASAQGYLAVAVAVVMAGAMAVSGELYARWQSGAYSAMAALAALGGLVLLAALGGRGNERFDGAAERASSQG
jgi:PPP family 3-phenylpropionic acid transporter